IGPTRKGGERDMNLLRTAVALVLAGTALAPTLRAAGDIDKKAVGGAPDLLKTGKRGKDNLSYVHFGSQYDGDSYKKTTLVTDGSGKVVPGHFALVYAYSWDGGYKTEVVFLCDARGNVYEVQAGDSDGVLSRPFVLADAAVKVLGNLLLEAFK